jgi:hypothetical protein
MMATGGLEGIADLATRLSERPAPSAKEAHILLLRTSSQLAWLATKRTVSKRSLDSPGSETHHDRTLLAETKGLIREEGTETFTA